MIKNISKYINVFKRPKSLKMKAKSAISKIKKTVKQEYDVAKLAGIKNYSKFKMNRIKKSKTYKKGKEYAGVALGSAIVGAGISSLASQAYNKYNGKK